MNILREKQLQEVELRKKEIMEKYNVNEKIFNVEKWKKDDFYKKIIEILRKNTMLLYIL